MVMRHGVGVTTEVRVIPQLWVCVSPSKKSLLSYVCSDPAVYKDQDYFRNRINTTLAKVSW